MKKGTHIKSFLWGCLAIYIWTWAHNRFGSSMSIVRVSPRFDIFWFYHHEHVIAFVAIVTYAVWLLCRPYRRTMARSWLVWGLLSICLWNNYSFYNAVNSLIFAILCILIAPALLWSALASPQTPKSQYPTPRHTRNELQEELDFASYKAAEERRAEYEVHYNERVARAYKARGDYQKAQAFQRKADHIRHDARLD